MVYLMALSVAQVMYGILNGPLSNSDYIWFWIVFSVAKAVSRQYLNLEARFRYQREPIWDVCWTKREGDNFCVSTSVFPCYFHSISASLSILLPPTLCRKFATRQRRWISLLSLWTKLKRAYRPYDRHTYVYVCVCMRASVVIFG